MCPITQTGALQLAGTSAAALQVVPSLNSFNNGNFNPSGTSRSLLLNGGGLIEGSIDVLFGDVTVSDPDAGIETIDVYYGNNTGLGTIIPDAAKGNVRVRSAGGTSNELIVAATSFTAILGVASRHTRQCRATLGKYRPAHYPERHKFHTEHDGSFLAKR